jgi:hypothetical protein
MRMLAIGMSVVTPVNGIGTAPLTVKAVTPVVLAKKVSVVKSVYVRVK